MPRALLLFHLFPRCNFFDGTKLPHMRSTNLRKATGRFNRAAFGRGRVVGFAAHAAEQLRGAAVFVGRVM
jgi:hypothetical protein